MSVSEKFDALVPTSMDQLLTLSDRISKSTLIPREYQGKPADCLLAMSMGMEIGLKPIQALQSIAVINNRPCLWGTAARALVMADPRLVSIVETDPAEVEKTGRARCEIFRKGFSEPFIGEFTRDNARKAQLTGKDSYTKYEGQMFTWRAFHMSARKAFPDLYKGLAPAEEMQATPVTVRQDEPTITLALDAPIVPVTQAELDESEREFPDDPQIVKSLTTQTEVAKVAPRGRPKAQPQTPAQPPPPTAVERDSSLAAPALCDFCHKPGHVFNDCPDNQPPAADAPTPQSRTETASVESQGGDLSEADILELMAVAKSLRPKTSMIFMMGVLDTMGYKDLTELPKDKMGELIKRMQQNA